MKNTEQLVREVFGQYLYKNDAKGVVLNFARAARKFVRLEQAEKHLCSKCIHYKAKYTTCWKGNPIKCQSFQSKRNQAKGAR